MFLFDGNEFAQTKEQKVIQRVQQLSGQKPHIAAILFREDDGSVLYTEKKREAAQRCGIGYSVFQFSFADPVENVLQKIAELNQDQKITGIIIQKPWRHTWKNYFPSSEGKTASSKNENLPDRVNSTTYNQWWHSLTSALDETKDVDGLHPSTMDAIKNNTWREKGHVLPATCKAVLEILDFSFTILPNINYQISTAIIGKSDLLGYPLLYELQNKGNTNVQLFGKKELQQRINSGQGLKDFQIIVSATGQQNLITGSLITDNCILIDVGEPNPDIDVESVKNKPAFLTPVPGGVGPVTVSCLLENAVELVYTSRS